MKKTKKRSPRAATAVDDYIGARMRDRRTDLGSSQAALAEKTGPLFSADPEIRERRKPRERGPLVRDLRGLGSFSSVDVRTQTESLAVEFAGERSLCAASHLGSMQL
jgi:hypothetical protein